MTGRPPLHREGGVYAAPADTARLRATFAGAGDLWRAVDLSAVRNKDGMLAALARALQFPPHFGHNWDALADSVQDLSWLQWSGLVLEVSGSEAFRRHAPQEWDTLLDILRAAATYWASHRKPFVVLVHGARELPAAGA